MAITPSDVEVAVYDWLAALSAEHYKNGSEEFKRGIAMEASAVGYGYRTIAARNLAFGGVDEYQRAVESFLNGLEAFSVTFQEIRTSVLSDDTGIAWGVYFEDFQEAGRPREHARVRFSQVWRRDDAGWHMLLFHRDIQPFDDKGRYPRELTIVKGD